MTRPDATRERLGRIIEDTRSELRRWTDDQGSDPGQSLAELLAFVADALSAYADAIADESFLGSRPRLTDLELTVDGTSWRRVGSLAASGPDDRHYVATVSKDGATVVEFGDGVHGRRPPSGSSTRVRYRSGRRYHAVTLQQGRVTLDTDVD